MRNRPTTSPKNTAEIVSSRLHRTATSAAIVAAPRRESRKTQDQGQGGILRERIRIEEIDPQPGRHKQKHAPQEQPIAAHTTTRTSDKSPPIIGSHSGQSQSTPSSLSGRLAVI